MADPIFSPDGKFVWTGSEWSPTPSGSSQKANVNLRDSAIGELHITQNEIKPPSEIVQCKTCRAKGRFTIFQCSNQTCGNEYCEHCKFDSSPFECPYCINAKLQLELQKQMEIDELERKKREAKQKARSDAFNRRIAEIEEGTRIRVEQRQKKADLNSKRSLMSLLMICTIIFVIIFLIF